jgi:mono/diheme cytochrome c family protein
LWFVLLAFGLIAVAAAAIIYRWNATRTSQAYKPRPPGEITFARDVAPLFHSHCAGCHRAGQSAPFSLITYADVKKHAQDIATVVKSGYMPPWPPEPGHGKFVGERRLNAEQIGVMLQWIAEGAPEGNPAEHPPAPLWSSDWQLGPPDLVMTLPHAYTVPAEGRDIYRNFVLPVELSSQRYVRAIEFRPGNPKVVHHTLIKVDSSGDSRRRDALDAEIGFPGMIVPTETGHFLGWQPGRGPCQVPEGMPWQIRPGTDLILQMHLSPSGKPELVQPSVGFYFTDQAPRKTPFRILLTSVKMDIPPGVPDFSVEDSYELPVDLEVIAILPHAHYVGKEIRAWATLPDGRTEPLIYIRNWDFNWQSDYQYAAPVFLPKGTKVAMRFTYDNSTNNIRNPSQPPRPVRYGPESVDEMAELWLQVVPKNPADLAILERHYDGKARQRFMDGNYFLAQRNPPDVEALATLGNILTLQGKLVEAEQHLLRAVSLEGAGSSAFYGLGVLRRRQERLEEARRAFERAIALEPTQLR